MRVTDAVIQAPPFPRGARWINVAPLRMDKQRGRPVLVEFWDFCRVNSLRTMPYLKAWHERYSDAGLRVVGIHTGGFEPSRDDDEVARAVERLEIPYPVVLDTDLQLWNLYGNQGWPGRYLWDGNGELFSWHYGEGAYQEAELELQELLGVTRAPLAPVRPEDTPGLQLPAQSEDVAGPYSGPYEAGGVWAVLSGAGSVTVNGAAREVAWPGCHELIDHGVHTPGVLELAIGEGVRCHATCFTPGVAPALGAPGPRAGG